MDPITITCLGLMALGTLTSAGADVASAIQTGEGIKQQRRQFEEQMRRADQQLAESKAKAEKEEKEASEKQKKLQNLYRNMKVNLYSRDINGIKNSELVQDESMQGGNNLIQ